MSGEPGASSAVTDNAGIIVALPEELATLTKQKLEPGQSLKLDHCWIQYSGAGSENAARAARELMEKGVDCLISWGCAAGLADDLKPGDLTLAKRVSNDQGDFDTENALHDNVHQRLIGSGVSVNCGKLFTSKNLVDSSDEKVRIRQLSKAIALDMESAAIAEVATQANLPFLAIRSIADPVTSDLPKAVLVSLNAEGQVELVRLLRHLLLHPLEIIGLIRLGLHFHAAQRTLKTVAEILNLSGADQAPTTN